MCSGFVDKIQKSTRASDFASVDASHGHAEAGISREDAMHEVHVAQGGKMYRGAEGILKVLEQYPRWRWLAMIGGLPIIKSLVSLGYRIVAVNRHRF